MAKEGFQLVSESAAAERWDSWLSNFEDRGIRQSHAWGAHKTESWSPVRAVLFQGGEPAAMALLLSRRAPLGAATLLWGNAGPVFQKGRGEADLSALAAFLKGLRAHARTIPRAVVRLAPRVPASAALEAALRGAGFSPARASLDSGRTVAIDLRPSLEELRAGLDRKWRNQLKKAEAASPVFEFGRGRDLLRRVLALHQETRRRKRLARDGVDLAALERAAGDFGPALTFAAGSAGGGNCALSWWTFAGRATLWLSASDERGMSLCLPNAAYWAAVERLRGEGATRFDLSGIDAERNPGVTHFKLGTGGAEIVTLGEWDWSASALPRAAFNALLGAVRERLAR